MHGWNRVRAYRLVGKAVSGVKLGKADLVYEVNEALHWGEKACRWGLLLRRTGQYHGHPLGWSLETKHREFKFETTEQLRVFFLAYEDARTP